MPFTSDGPDLVIHGDNLAAIEALPDAAFRLVYLDPPFNTGRTQQRQTITTKRSSEGSRTGFQGRSYETIKGTLTRYDGTGSHALSGGVNNATVAFGPQGEGFVRWCYACDTARLDAGVERLKRFLAQHGAAG